MTLKRSAASPWHFFFLRRSGHVTTTRFEQTTLWKKLKHSVGNLMTFEQHARKWIEGRNPAVHLSYPFNPPTFPWSIFDHFRHVGCILLHPPSGNQFHRTWGLRLQPLHAVLARGRLRAMEAFRATKSMSRSEVFDVWKEPIFQQLQVLVKQEGPGSVMDKLGCPRFSLQFQNTWALN